MANKGKKSCEASARCGADRARHQGSYASARGSQSRAIEVVLSDRSLMTPPSRLEAVLTEVVRRLTSAGCPPSLGAAIHQAVLGGGRRLRPRLTYAAAAALGMEPDVALDHTAAAIELVHGAALTHGDLPCHDDVMVRHGLPSLHRAFGDGVALLAGDALTIAAFALIAEVTEGRPRVGAQLIRLLAEAAGAPAGVVAAAGWAAEADASITAQEHARARTLFEAAAVAPALLARDGGDTALDDSMAWRRLGAALAEVYQLAREVRDLRCSTAAATAPSPEPMGRGPALASRLALDRAVNQLAQARERARATAPRCAAPENLLAFLDELPASVGLTWPQLHSWQLQLSRANPASHVD